MRKLYFVIFLNICVAMLGRLYAQAPAISYTSPQNYVAGTAITPLTLKNTGGAIPAGFYALTSTIAGSGDFGLEDGVAGAAKFNYPTGIAKDPSGNIFIADASNNVIRKLTPAGIVTTFAGSPTGASGTSDGAGTAARFNYPAGVVADKDGNIFVTDFANSSIRKITPAGVVTTLAGTSGANGLLDGTGPAAKFNFPNGIAYDATTEDIIVADTYNNRIRRVTQGGLVTTIAILNSTTTPNAVTVDKVGNIYITDSGNNAIIKKTPDNQFSTITSSLFANPLGIAIDKFDNLYVTNKTSIITKTNTTNATTVLFAGLAGKKALANGIDTAARFSDNSGIAYDSDGNLLIADSENRVIRKSTLYGVDVDTRLINGLTMDNAGTISGTPVELATAANFSVTAYNATGSSKATITFTVTKPTLPTPVLTFPVLANKTYGDVQFLGGATSTNTTLPIVYTSSNTAIAKINKDTIIITGTGNVTITASQPGNAVYNSADPKTQSFSIAKAPLTITAASKGKVPGADNPPLTANYTGFVYKETSAVLTTQPTLTTTATKASPGGSYPITVSGATAANYNITYVNGSLDIVPVPTISAGGSTLFQTGSSVALSASPATGYQYQWYNDTTAVAGATASTFKATETGNYTVRIGLTSGLVASNAIKVTVSFYLPPDNFAVSIVGLTCKGSNNGSVTVTPKRPMLYTAYISGVGYQDGFTFDKLLTINSLKPGNYALCVYVQGQPDYSQCFSINVPEPKDLSLYSTINKDLNTLNLQLGGSDGAYNITLNDKTYSTTDNQITLPLKSGPNKLAVTTDRLCQGVIEKVITLDNATIPYPNPFTNVLNVNLGDKTIKSINYNVFNVTNGKLVYTGQSKNQSGVLGLDLSAVSGGIYYLKLNLDGRESAFKVIKQ